MLFEDLYDSFLRRYRTFPPKADAERQIVRGRLYEWLESTRPAREGQTNKVQEENVKRKNPSE